MGVRGGVGARRYATRSDQSLGDRRYNEVGHLFPIDIFSPGEIAEIRAYIDDLLPKALAAGWNSYEVVNRDSTTAENSVLVQTVDDPGNYGDPPVALERRAAKRSPPPTTPPTPSETSASPASCDHPLGGSPPSIASRNRNIPDDGLSRGKSVPSRLWRSSRARARRAASARRGM